MWKKAWFYEKIWDVSYLLSRHGFKRSYSWFKESIMVDTISDMFAMIKNAQAVKKNEVFVPFSRFKFEIAKALYREGFIEKFEKVKRKIKKGKSSPKPFLKLILKYQDGMGMISGIKRISKPSQRIYSGYLKLNRFKKMGGILILSTPKGVLTDKEARKLKVGGEVICNIW